MFALIPDDGTNGLMIGERHEVQAVADCLTAFLVSGGHNGEIKETDPQLGAIWLTPQEASERWDVAYSSVTWACRKGHIRDAVTDGKRGWRFPQRTFLAWLAKRSKPRQ